MMFASKTLSSLFCLTTILSQISSAEPTVFLIRHGEKPDSGNGLNAQGQQRAQCLVNVFGQSHYNIGYILAERPKSDGSRERPYDTVKPFADSQGLSINTSCDKSDSQCVADAVANYQGNGNILICWEHQELTDIAEALGYPNAPEYPDCRFDLIWTDPSPYSSFSSITNECCPGLDDSICDNVNTCPS